MTMRWGLQLRRSNVDKVHPMNLCFRQAKVNKAS